MGSIESKLASLPLLSDLTPEELKRLCAGVDFVTRDRDQRLFSANENADYVYIVFFGTIKLLKPSLNERELVMCFLSKGDFCGAGVIRKEPPAYPVSAVTHEDAGLLRIPRREFINNWTSDPHIAQIVQQNMLNRLMEFQHDKVLAPAPVQARIASFLLRTLDSQGESFGNTISIRLTRRDIADRVGTTIETVIRVLSDWTQKNWITTSDQRIEVLSKDELRKLIQD